MDDFKEYCKFTLTHINDWLRFAEAKNGVLLGVSLSLAISLFPEISVIKQEPQVIFPVVKIMSFLYFSLSALVALASFFPKLEVFPLRSEQIRASDNLLFFGDLKNYSKDGLISAWTNRNNRNESEVPPICEDFAEQIVLNSMIAATKYRNFEIGYWLFLYAVLTPIVVFPIQLVISKRRRKVSQVGLSN